MQKPERGLFQKRGDWWIRFTDAAGKYRREKIGRSREAAVKVLARRRNEATIGEKLPELRSRGILFETIADDAIAYVRVNYSRPADDVARLEVVKSWFRGRPARSLASAEIASRLRSERLMHKWSASTFNHYLTVISLAYTLAVEAGKVREKPLLEKESEKASERVRFLSPAEETRLRAVLRAHRSWKHHEPEMDLAMHTGLRRDTMYYDLVWENVDLESRTARIPSTKNGDPLTVPLNDIAMRALTIFGSRGDGTGRVVRNIAGETLNVNAHWFPDALRAAGIVNFHWHDLRHTFASRLRQAGVPLGHIAELLGHRGLQMTRRYAHLSISNLHDAVSTLSRSTTVAPELLEETRAAESIN